MVNGLVWHSAHHTLPRGLRHAKRHHKGDHHIMSANDDPMRMCQHCGITYQWRKSPSSLKMTYCGNLCEKADLGFLIEDLLHAHYVVLPRTDKIHAATATFAPVRYHNGNIVAETFPPDRPGLAGSAA